MISPKQLPDFSHAATKFIYKKLQSCLIQDFFKTITRFFSATTTKFIYKGLPSCPMHISICLGIATRFPQNKLPDFPKKTTNDEIFSKTYQICPKQLQDFSHTTTKFIYQEIPSYLIRISVCLEIVTRFLQHNYQILFT